MLICVCHKELAGVTSPLASSWRDLDEMCKSRRGSTVLRMRSRLYGQKDSEDFVAAST